MELLKQWKSLSSALAIAALASVQAAPALALPEDRDQPIYIQSNSAERDDRKGTTVYTGDVEVDQGSLHISADRLVIYSIDDEVERMEAFGAPARMQQKTSVDKEPVYARARKINYLVDREELTLTGTASVTQEGATMTGSQITYYMREQRVKAGDIGTAPNKSRVRTVIPPRERTPASGATDAKPPTPAPVGTPVAPATRPAKGSASAAGQKPALSTKPATPPSAFKTPGAKPNGAP